MLLGGNFGKRSMFHEDRKLELEREHSVVDKAADEATGRARHLSVVICIL